MRVLARARLGWESLRPLPDGRSVLAFRFDRRSARVRRRIDLRSGRSTRLPVVSEGSGSFSPDGTRVFAEAVSSEPGAATLRTLGGRLLARLRPRFPDLSMSATWSPDGRVLAVVDQQDDTRTRFRVRLLDARTGGVLAARAVAGGEPVPGPQAFAPAADSLAFALVDSRRASASRALVLDLRSGAATPFGAAQRTFTDPAWSPDGRRIAVVLGGGGVALLDAVSGAPAGLVATPGGVADGPAWSPDGTRLAYRLSAGLSEGLAVADVRTGAVRLLLRPVAAVADFAWTRDGSGLVVDARG